MRRTIRIATFAIALAMASSGTARATVTSLVSFAPPDDGRQTLTVTLADDTAGSTATLYETYRQVSSEAPPTLDDACPSTMAVNHDARLIDGVTAGPEPYSVTRSVSLPLGVYAVCDYSAYPESRVLADAALRATSIAGAYAAHGIGSARRPTAISLSLLRTGTHGRFSGGIAGTRKGKVLIQRRARGRWRAVKRCRARHARFSTRAAVHRGARYRARLVGTKAYAGSASRPLRAR